MRHALFHRDDLLQRDFQRDARHLQRRIRAGRVRSQEGSPVPTGRGWARLSPPELPTPGTPTPGTPTPGTPTPGTPTPGLPEIHTRELSPAILVTALARSGALLVRDLVPGSALSGLATATREVVRACADAADRGEANRAHGLWHHPPAELRDWMPDGELGRSRGFHRASGSAMCVEAPTVAEALLELYEALNLKALAAAALGDAPCLSAKKMGAAGHAATG